MYSAALGGDSFQPFAFAVAWRVLITAATPPAAFRMLRNSVFVNGSLA